jgi:hypothetical protein
MRPPSRPTAEFDEFLRAQAMGLHGNFLGLLTRGRIARTTASEHADTNSYGEKTSTPA